jgi:CheY-like chemotaxis protein
LNAHHSILLIEDDRIDAMTVTRALRDLGSTNPLHHVTDGEKALSFLVDPASPRPMLILLDLNMPRMNGAEFLAVIKADDLFRAIPIVVLTTSQEDRDRLRAFDLSAAGYIVKPVDYTQFVNVMRTVLDYWTTSQTPPI